MKAEQIRATGAKYCVAPCANCKKQLRELMEDHGIDCQIVGLHDLLYKAIVFDEQAERPVGEELLMESWIEFGRGPLFRSRICADDVRPDRVRVALTISGVVEAYRRTADQRHRLEEMPGARPSGGSFPFRRLLKKRPVYSALILPVPRWASLPCRCLLAAHIILWRRSVGIGWPAIATARLRTGSRWS